MAKKKAGRSKWAFILKLAVLTVSIPAIILAVFLIYYYYEFDRTINAKLGKDSELAVHLAGSKPHAWAMHVTIV